MDNLLILPAIIAVVVIVVLFKFISISNKLRRYQVIINESKRNVDIALAKRYDTISDMIKVAKSFATHEKNTLSDIVRLRQEGSITDSNDAIKNQNDAIRQIYALAESYPELKSSDEFLNLQEEIDDENEKLAACKRIVNNNISIFNQEVVSFPSSVVASVINIKQLDFLVEEDLSNKKSIDNFDYNV